MTRALYQAVGINYIIIGYSALLLRSEEAARTPLSMDKPSTATAEAFPCKHNTLFSLFP